MTKETVFSLEAASLREDLKGKRAELRKNPADRVFELKIEAMEEQVRRLDRNHDARVKRVQQHEADAKQREQAARVELETRLMDDYRKSAPGTTEAEAKAALPDLLHRHRLGEIERHEQHLADARRRIRQVF
jgi:hypothetical protein